MTPVIFHVDMDAFFVSVEELYDPSLRGKAVIVGGRPNQRGVVAAASYEARRYGVHSAMPLTQAARLCPHTIFLPVRRERYWNASKQIEEIFRRFAPRMEMVSVDEAYLDLTGTERLYGSPFQAAHSLHEEIARRTRLPCSIGISGSRLVSKIASDQAKPNGILWVRPGNEVAFLAPLPIGKMPGVGKVTEEGLRAMGVSRIGDMAKLEADILVSALGQHGLELRARARAEGLSAEESVADWIEFDHAKSVSHEETFGEDLLDGSVLEMTLADLSQRVAARLREHGLYARTITLKLRYSNFQTLTRAQSLPEPTNLDGAILEASRRLFRQTWDRRRKVRLLGVQAGNLSPQAGQANLLTASATERWGRSLAAADRVRARYGFSSVQLASSLQAANPEQAPTRPKKRKRTNQLP